MVEVYKLTTDVTNYRILAPSDSSFIKEKMYVFDGTSRIATWHEPTFWVYNPILPSSDFVSAGGTIAFGEKLKANHRVMECLEMSGEFLPIRLETGERYYILNVTDCINSLDHSACMFGRYYDTESQSVKQGSLEGYAFHPERISSAPIFKVPETVKAHVLTSRNTGRLHCPDDFMTVYEEEGLTGLKFEKVWEGG